MSDSTAGSGNPSRALASLREKIIDPRVDDPDYLMSLRPKTPVPPHEGPSGGIGSAEDSLRSVYSISPQKKIQNIPYMRSRVIVVGLC